MEKLKHAQNLFEGNSIVIVPEMLVLLFHNRNLILGNQEQF